MGPYSVYIDDKLIGTTNLEHADAPMGVVFGNLYLQGIDSGYTFFKNYCDQNNIEYDDYTEEKILSTRVIPKMEVFNNTDAKISDSNCSIFGRDDEEGFQIIIEGISYPFYEEEFPHHVRSYENIFKK